MSQELVGGSPGPPCPPNWTRTITQGKAVYTTPLGHEICNLTQLRDFLLSDVTCKCNLPCPLIVDQWFDFSSGNKRAVVSPVTRRGEASQKKMKVSRDSQNALLTTRLLTKKADASQNNDQEVYRFSPSATLLPACKTSLETALSPPLAQNGAADSKTPLATTSACTNHQQDFLQRHSPQLPTTQQQTHLEFSGNRNEHLVNDNNISGLNKQQPLFVTTVETPHLYQQPLQVYCSPTPTRPIILNSSGSVQNPLLSPQQPELILNGATGQLSAVDLNTVNSINNAPGLLSTTQLFPYPHMIDSISPASIVLGVSMGSSVSMGIMGLDSSHLQQLPTLTTGPNRDLNQSQGGSTLVVSPYGMTPMSLEGIPCGVLQTSNATLDNSHSALNNSASAATVISAQAAARTANGATLLSPPVPSVCHILPISPMMNAENAAPVDSNENALLFNVTLDESAVLLQPQECDVNQ
ncbi:uncharacterized protein LOC100905570 [Galendromus occidentalis]|uniref:Uncharacterized protein LOC100905570 n=1 Tax=Galendromus occidentalis TaxID=34638 RepID=A0AAJ6QR48_9ACAR|nr:uncharacterized protein LOC100905570 [Galendromus occidentalis]